MTIIFSWLNNIWTDFYEVSQPVAFITFVYYAIIIAQYPAQIANVNLLGLQSLAEKVDDQGAALERFETVKTQPRIGILCAFFLLAFNQAIQL